MIGYDINMGHIRKLVRMRLKSLGIALLGFFQFLNANAGELTDQQLNEKIRDYILSNPQIILQAMELLGEQQAELEMAERVGPFYEQLIQTDTDLTIGSPNAPVKVIEFFDYRCAACQAMVPTLQAFVTANPDVVFIKKHLPILTPSSERGSRYTLATHAIYGPESYAAMHTYLYTARLPLNEATFEEAALDLGLDHAKIMTAYDSDDVTQVINTNRDMAIDLEIRGTPAFLTPQKLHVGTMTFDDLNTFIGTAPSQ